MINKIKCRYCKAINYKKEGFRKTENRGKIQKYKCLDCGKYFTFDDGFYRMRNNESKITSAIDLYFSNLSSRKVRNFFRRHLDHNASHITVLNWCRKYVLKVSSFTEKLQPQLSGKFYADGTEIDCSKRNDIFWCAVDWDTRFIPATLYSLKQDYKNALEFLKRIKTKKVPQYIQTDSANFYPAVFNKVFGQGKRKYDLRTEHRIINTSKTGKYNVRIETVFSKIKDRVDDFRGLKSIKSAPILLMGLIIQHNFIESHTTTGKVPCELAGLNLELGENRWLGLIRLSSS